MVAFPHHSLHLFQLLKGMGAVEVLPLFVDTRSAEIEDESASVHRLISIAPPDASMERRLNTHNVNPPTCPINDSGSATTYPCDGENNVLQAAINVANDGDIIIMAPGKYYTSCPTQVTKKVTIRGACWGVPAPNDPSWDPLTGPRPMCTSTGETVWIASSNGCGGVSNGSLQGINIAIDGVTIDGLSFKEEDSTFRAMISVLATGSPLPGYPAANGEYHDIKILNNYMKGDKLSSTWVTGGTDNTLWPQTYDGLEYR